MVTKLNTLPAGNPRGPRWGEALAAAAGLVVPAPWEKNALEATMRKGTSIAAGTVLAARAGIVAYPLFFQRWCLTC